MGSLLHLQDAHERAQLLLPWRVNGTLDEAEAVLFDAHLAECAECRADLSAEEGLRAALASMPLGLELRDPPKVAGAVASPRLRPPGRRRFFARRIPLGWAFVGQAAAAVAVAAFFMVPHGNRETASGYRLLGAEETHQPGNVIVLFAPDATQSDLRAALEQVDARVVDGPTASGAFMVHVAPGARAAALERLRGTKGVILAEAVDADGSP